MLKIDELYLFGSRAQTNVPEFEGKRDSANISSLTSDDGKEKRERKALTMSST